MGRGASFLAKNDRDQSPASAQIFPQKTGPKRWPRGNDLKIRAIFIAECGGREAGDQILITRRNVDATAASLVSKIILDSATITDADMLQLPDALRGRVRTLP